MINVMMAWRYHFSQAGSVADKLAIAANKSNLDLVDLSEGLKYVAATARDLNQPLDTVLAQLMTLANMGIKGSMAGTALENMYRYLSRAAGDFKTGRQVKAFEAIGLTAGDFVDAQGNLKPMVDIFDMLSTKVNSLEAGNVKLQAWLEAIFGVRGKRASSAFLRNLDMVRKNLDLVSNSAGQAGNIMGQMMATLEGDFKKLRAAWKAFKNEFTRAVEPIVKPLLVMLKGFVNVLTWFASSPPGKIITPMIVGMIALKTAMWGVKTALYTIMLTLGRFGAEFKAVQKTVAIGWRVMALEAMGYNLAASGSPIIGGMYKNKGGMVIDAKTGRFVSAAKAAQYNKNFTGSGKGILAGMLGGSLGRILGGKAAAGAGAGIFGRLLGFLGGPWGIALSVGLPLLITLISKAFSKNSNALDENTQAIKENIDVEKNKNRVSQYFSNEEVYAKVMNKTMEEIVAKAKEYMDILTKMGGDATMWGLQKNALQIYVDAPYYVEQQKRGAKEMRFVINAKP